MKVKRTVKGGRVVILGRPYALDKQTKADVEGQQVYVDDDGVCRTDMPKWGVRTADSIRVFYPTQYDWFINASLDE